MKLVSWNNYLGFPLVCCASCSFYRFCFCRSFIFGLSRKACASFPVTGFSSVVSSDTVAEI